VVYIYGAAERAVKITQSDIEKTVRGDGVVYIYGAAERAVKITKPVTHSNSLTLSGRTPAIAMILSRMG